MRDAPSYRENAAHFRKLALEADEETAAKLRAVADDYDALALRHETDLETPPDA